MPDWMRKISKMAKALGKATCSPANSRPSVNRVRIRLFWRVLEIEGEGLISVVGGLVIGLMLVGWFIFFR
jgi:hypothetical protein